MNELPKNIGIIPLKGKKKKKVQGQYINYFPGLKSKTGW